MSDPLYGHPAWKVGGESDSVDVDHVISEIVKTNYVSKSHDQPSEKGHDGHQSECALLENSVGKRSSDEELDTERTTASELCTVGERTPHRGVMVQTIGQSSGEDTSSMTTEARGQSIEMPVESKGQSVAVAVESKGQSIEVAVESKGQTVGEAAIGSDKQAGELVKERTESSLELCQSGRSHVSLVDELKSAECDGDVSCDPDCTECKTVHADPTPSELMMYLHALSYKVRTSIVSYINMDALWLSVVH